MQRIGVDRRSTDEDRREQMGTQKQRGQGAIWGARRISQRPRGYVERDR